MSGGRARRRTLILPDWAGEGQEQAKPPARLIHAKVNENMG